MRRNDTRNPIAEYRKKRYSKPTWGSFVLGLAFFFILLFIFNFKKDFQPYNEAELTVITPSQTSTIEYEALRYKIYPTGGKDQIDRKISIIESVHNASEKKDYTVMERIAQWQIDDIESLQYMYKKSKSYKEMVSRELYDIMPKGIDIEKKYSSDEIRYERITFYVNEPASLILKISCTVQKGNISFLLVSPDGEGVLSTDPLSMLSKTYITEADKGLWSLVISYHPEEGTVFGDLTIDGTIVKEFDRMDIAEDIIYPDKPAIFGHWNLDEGDFITFKAVMEENGAQYRCRIGTKSTVNDGYFSLSSTSGSAAEIHIQKIMRGIYQEKPYAIIIETDPDTSENKPIKQLKGEIVIYKKIK